ncbi:MAG: hypothetical protein BGO95_04900 [Micrococcales bacterium 73-13]|nr:MAG: hypothetical protein BGO95_04900 [Micrococcales bacterium 73-13]
MTDTTPERKSLTNGIRVALGVGGLVALILGVLILVWPTKTAAVVTALIAIYAIVQGLVYGGIGIFSKKLGVWARIGHVVLGLVFIAAGIIAFANLSGATTVLALIVAIFIGASWIVEGIVAFTLLGRSTASKGWTIFYGILSVVAGIVVILAPFWAIAILWLVLGISLVVLGVIQIVRAFMFGSSRRA